MAVNKSFQVADGVEMPSVGFGTWKVRRAYQVVQSAIDEGYRHIDCAIAYGNEDDVGRAIAEKIKQGAVKREDLFLTGKLWCTHLHPDNVREQLEATLKNLQTDYLDCYLIHYPIAVKYGKDWFPQDEKGKPIYADVDYVDTWKAMESLVDEGLIRCIGVSNFNHKQLQRVLDNSRIKPAILQIEINPFQTNEKLVKYAQERGVVVTGYSPFGSPDRSWAKSSDPDVFRNMTLVQIGREHQRMVPQVVQRWVLQRGCAVLAKTEKPNRIRSNIQVHGFELSDEEMQAISALHNGYRACDAFMWTGSPHYPFNEKY